MTHPIVALVLSKQTSDGFTDGALLELADAFRAIARDPAGVVAVYETIGLLASHPENRAGRQLVALVGQLLQEVAPSGSAIMTSREHPFQRFGGFARKLALSAAVPKGAVSAKTFVVPRRA